jgi:hypothetical protein
MAEKKLGRGKRQPSRAKYKASNKCAINAKKRADAQENFIQKKSTVLALMNRGAKRRARRAKWRSANPNMPFADFEKREPGMSAWEYQCSIFGTKIEQKPLQDLKLKLAA